MIYSPNIPYTDTSAEAMPNLQINILKHWENNHFNRHNKTPNLKEKSSEPYYLLHLGMSSGQSVTSYASVTSGS